MFWCSTEKEMMAEMGNKDKRGVGMSIFAEIDPRET